MDARLEEFGEDYWSGMSDGFEMASEALSEAVQKTRPSHRLTATDVREALRRAMADVESEGADPRFQGMQHALAIVLGGISKMLDSESTPSEVMAAVHQLLVAGGEYAEREGDHE